MFEDSLARLANLTGTPIDYLKLFSIFLVAYPLAAPLPHLQPLHKHVANFGLSSLFLVPIMGLYSGYLQLVGTTLATYYIAKFKIGGKKMPWLVFALQMGHLTVNHIVRHFGNIPLTTIEITAAQMVLVMNLTTFAWDVYDGQQRTLDQCDDSQKKSRIATMPSLIEFLGYAFYFPGVMIGPSTRFVDYHKWSTNELYPPRKDSTSGDEKKTSKGKDLRPSPPGRIAAALTELGVGISFMAIYSLFGAGWDYSMLIRPMSEGGVSDWVWWKRILFANMAGFMARTKYYGVWTLTNGACVMSGLGYNGLGPDGKRRWNRCRNIDILKIEFANNWKELLDAWNINTNIWLRNNVYKRLTRPGRKPGFKTTMATFLTSAFWHGVAPGYYLAFFLGGVFSSIARSLRRHLRPVYFGTGNTPNPTIKTLGNYTFSQLLYTGLSILSVQTTLNFTVAPFQVLDFHKSLAAYHSLSWYGFIVAGVGIAAFRGGAGKWLDKQSGRVRRPKGVTSASDVTDDDVKTSEKRGRRGELQVPDVDALEQFAKEADREAILKEAQNLGLSVKETIEEIQKRAKAEL